MRKFILGGIVIAFAFFLIEHTAKIHAEWQWPNPTSASSVAEWQWPNPTSASSIAEWQWPNLTSANSVAE